MDPSKFLEHIGGTASPGNHWMLVFTAGAKDVSVSSRAIQSKDTVVCGVNPTENGDSYSLASPDARQGSDYLPIGLPCHNPPDSRFTAGF